MDKTASYGLNKPTYDESADIATLNENTDIIDTALTPTADPTQVPTGNGPGKLGQWVSWLTNRIKAITGSTNWWDTPVTTIEALNSGKQATITGAASTITTNNLAAGRALVTNASGKVMVSAVTSEELDCLFSASENIQDQLNAKETPAGAQAKANTAENNAKAYVGDKTALQTTAKSTIVAAVNELFTNVSDGKNLVASAITDKGVPASGSDTFPVLAGKIEDIPAGGEYGTATAAQVLSGYTIGTESGIVAGNIPSKGAATITPGTTNQTIAAGQYLSGVQTIIGDANLSPANIKSGVNIFGVSGALSSNSIKSIQHITITLSTGVNSVSTSINSVIPANTIILCNGFHANNTGASPAANFVYFELYNAATVKAYRYQASSTYYAYASAIIIEFGSNAVKSKQIGYLASRQTASIAQVDPAKSILTCAGLYSAETSGTGYWPGSFFNLYLQNNTTIYAGTTTAGATTCYWNLMEFY